MERALRTLLGSLGDDPTREKLKKTPVRWRKAMEFLTSGYDQNLQKIVNGALDRTLSKEMVIVSNIEFYSLCEHHLLPFFGGAHVAYLPGKHIIGLSKIPRIVDIFARRLQAQERLTEEIATALEKVLKPRGIAVILDAQHLCMMMRGVQKQGARVRTQCFRGIFKRNDDLREEFLLSIAGSLQSRV